VLLFAETDKDLAQCFPPQYGSLLQGFAADEGDLAGPEWHEFPEGEEPQVLTAVLKFCSEGKHGDCPGHASSEEDGGGTVFCVCPCHQVPHEA
jgi:hypothetical protein